VNGGTSSGQLIVGNGTDDTSNNIFGWVSIDEGTLLQYGSLVLGDNEGFFGEVNVEGNFFGGPFTQLNLSSIGSSGNPTVQVGNEGTGTLNLDAGARMNLTNNSGFFSIGVESTGVGYVDVQDQFTMLTVPQNFVVGQSGFGTLTVADGAFVRTTQNSRSNYVSIGRDVTGVGNVFVDGTGTLLRSASTLRVGESGLGYLSVTNGAMVDVIDGSTPLIGPPPPFMSIGANATGVGSVLVDGLNSRLLVRRDLQVGGLGQGTLTVSDGGIVQILDNPLLVPTIVVGPYGRVVLDGGTLAGSTPDATPPPGMPATFGTNLQGFLGGSGLVRGTVQVGENAFVETEAGDLLRFEGAVSNQGAVTVDGGEIQFNKQFSNNAAVGPIPPGRISVENGGTIRFRELLTNNGVLSSAHGATNIHGEIDNPGNIVVARDTVATFYDLVNNTGTITVKPGGNALFLTDLVFLGLSLVQLGVDSNDLAQNSSQISSAGQITLGGTLEVSVEGGYDQLIGQPLELISASGGIVGQFDSVILPLVPNDLEVGLQYSSNGLMLEVQLIGASLDLPGDYNEDGTVDAADYSVWRNNFGSPNSLPNDDTPGVDQDDYARWKSNFGNVSLHGAGAFAQGPPIVPEPSACLLVFVGLALLLNVRAHIAR
jgi:T5SS/PEP-CTERM-associated repeat protein